MYPAALAAVLAVSSIQPFGASPQPSAVTEAEFLAVLDEGHPAFVVLNEAVGLARAEAIRAATLDNPDLDFVREAPSGATEQLELTVAWQPPHRRSRRLSTASAEKAVEAARAGVDADRMTIRGALRRTFAEWAVAAARAERSRGHVERIAELAERERRRAERGESSGLEARRLRLAVTEARSRLALAEAATLRARGTARGWRPDLSADAVPMLPGLRERIQMTAAEHPRLTALAAELEAVRLAREAATHTLRWPKLVAGWQRQDDAEGPILGLSWALPVANRRQAEQSRTQARVEAAEARFELARRQVEAELAGALAAYERLASAAVAATRATADNPQLVEAAVATFRYGEASLTDLLETLRSALAAELAALDLHAAALAAHRDLEAAAGQTLTTPPPQRTHRRFTP